jgi:hypothetical protein
MCSRRFASERCTVASWDSPSLTSPGPHIRINQVAAISNEGDVHFLTYRGTMTGERFTKFLDQLIRSSTRKVFLIMDRLRAHESATVQAWLKAHQDRIELFTLPAYFYCNGFLGDLTQLSVASPFRRSVAIRLQVSQDLINQGVTATASVNRYSRTTRRSTIRTSTSTKT